MKISTYGAAALVAVTFSFCANAKEAPTSIIFKDHYVTASADRKPDKCTTVNTAMSALAGDRGAVAHSGIAKCAARNRSVMKAMTYTNERKDSRRGQIADGDRGTLFSFFKASDGKRDAAPRGSENSRNGAKGAGKGNYGSLIARHASAHGIPVRLARAVVRVESNFRANARGSAGEIGLMQLKLSTARMMGYRGSAKGLYHPETNIKYGMKYLAKAQSLSGGSTCGTILKYNAGHGAKRMNPVSARYCAKVKRLM